MSELTGQEIVRQIEAHRAELAKLGVRRLEVFGSFARGEAGPESDIDLLVGDQDLIGAGTLVVTVTNSRSGEIETVTLTENPSQPGNFIATLASAIGAASDGDGSNGSINVLAGDDLVITGNGPFTFPTSLSDGASYDVTVLSQPNGVNTVVLNGSGVINGADVTDVYVDSGAGTVLQNDGWSDGQNAAFQGGFVAGEIGAVRLVPGQPGDIEQIELLFGGSTAQQTVTLHIWDDSAEQINPGALLFSGDYLLTGADDAINVIDISAEQIQVPGPFRVGIEFQHTGYPSIARDDDGTINIDRNFIFTSNTWFRSNLFGVTGDWIIRARMAGQPAAVESVPIVSEHVYLAPTPLQSGALTVSFRSGGDGAMPHSVSIFDVTGRLVWSAAGSEFADVTGSTGDSWTWDGLDAHGREVASGVYLVRIETATQDYVKRFAVVR